MTLVYEQSTEESIHLSVFPGMRDYDATMLCDVDKVRTIIAQSLKLRNEQNLKIKQPLSNLYLGINYKSLSAYELIIRDELDL